MPPNLQLDLLPMTKILIPFPTGSVCLGWFNFESKVSLSHHPSPAHKRPEWELSIIKAAVSGSHCEFLPLTDRVSVVMYRLAVVMYRCHDATTEDNPLGVDTFVITGAWSAGVVGVVMCGGKQDTRPCGRDLQRYRLYAQHKHNGQEIGHVDDHQSSFIR